MCQVYNRPTFTLQNAVPYNGLVPDPNGTSVHFPRENKTLPEEMLHAASLLSGENGNMALVDSGKGVSALNLGAPPLDDFAANQLGELVGAQGKWKRARMAAGDMVDISNLWRKGEGSRAVTENLMMQIDKLPAADVKNLDSEELRTGVGKVLREYERNAAALKSPLRNDWRNLMRIMAKEGLEGVRKALKNPEISLPAIAAIGVFPAILQSQQAQPSEPPRTPY